MRLPTVVCSLEVGYGVSWCTLRAVSGKVSLVGTSHGYFHYSSLVLSFAVRECSGVAEGSQQSQGLSLVGSSTGRSCNVATAV